MDMPFNVQMVHSIPSPPLNIPQMQLNQGPPVHVPPAMMLQFGDSNALHSQMLQVKTISGWILFCNYNTKSTGGLVGSSIQISQYGSSR
jgi:hypothetical protein